MPNTDNIDERVVEMRIDNRQFVSGAEKTISILDKLKAALSFKGADDGLSNLQKAADKIDLSHISDSLDKISDRFTNTGIVGMRVIENLTDAAYNFVKSTAYDLSVGQISAGFDKYTSILESTKTIMAATREDTSWVGTYDSQMDFVNAKLEDLMWFTDETSFNLADMTANIGKFTNAGVPLERAVRDMEGVATWAGLSGASAQEASRAMYNLSQAMALGEVRLMDWRSIENANMATLEFKQTVLEIAAEAGRLEKVGDGLYKTVAGSEVSATNFTEALSEGWFDSSVLESALHEYSAFADIIKQTMASDTTDLEDYGVTTTKLLEYLEKLEAGEMTFEEWQEELRDKYKMGDDLPDLIALHELYDTLMSDELELGRRAFKASQEYKTFKDAIDATKDAVSTGWMKTFQYIIGDAEESKKVWTALGNELYDIFALGGERRNDILEIWHTGTDEMASGYDTLKRAIANLYQGIRTYIDPITEAFDAVFSWGNIEDAAATLIYLTEEFEAFTESISLSDEAMEGLSSIFYSLFKGFQKGAGYVGSFAKKIGSAIGVIKDFADIFLSAFGLDDNGNLVFNSDSFLAGLEDLPEGLQDIFFTASDVLLSVGEDLYAVWDFIKSAFQYGVDVISKVFNNEDFNVFGSLLRSLNNLYQAVRSVIRPIVQAFTDFFQLGNSDRAADVIITIVSAFESFTERLILGEEASNTLYSIFMSLFEGAQKLFGALKPLFSFLGKGFNYVKDFVALVFRSFGAEKGSRLQTFIDGVTEMLAPLKSKLDNVWGSISGFIESLKKDYPIIQKIFDWFSGLNINWSGIGGAFESLRNSLSGLFSGVFDDPNASFRDRVKLFFSNVVKGLIDALKDIKLSDVFEGVKTGTLLYVGYQIASFFTTLSSGAKKWKNVPEAITETFESISGAVEEYGKSLKGNTMLKMAGAILVLAGAMWIMAKIPRDDFTAVAVSLILMFLALAKISKGFSGNKTLLSDNKRVIFNVLPKFAAGMIAAAVLLGVGVAALIKVAELSNAELARGLIGLLGIMAIAVGGMYLMSKSLAKLKNGKALWVLVGLAAAIYASAAAVALIAQFDFEEILAAGLVIAAIIGMMTLFILASSKMKAGSGVGVILSMVGLLASIYLLIPVIILFTQFDWDEIGVALFALAGIAAVLVVFVGLLAKFGGSGKAIVGAAALFIVAAAMVVFAVAMTLAIPAFVALAEAAVIVGDIIETSNNLGKTILVLLGLAVAFILVGAGAALLGTGILFAGIGFLAFGAGLLFAAAAIQILGDALVPVAEAMVQFFEFCQQNGEALIGLVAWVLTAVLTVIVASKFKVAFAIFSLIMAAVYVLSDSWPEISQALSVIFGLLYQFIKEEIPRITDFLVDAIIILFNSVGNSLRSRSGALASAIENMLSAILEIFVKVFWQIVGDLWAELTKGSASLLKGFLDKIPDKAKEWIPGLDTLSEWADSYSDPREVASRFAAIGDARVKDIQDAFGVTERTEVDIDGLVNPLQDALSLAANVAEQGGENVVGSYNSGVDAGIRGTGGKWDSGSIPGAVQKDVEEAVEVAEEGGESAAEAYKSGYERYLASEGVGDIDLSNLDFGSLSFDNVDVNELLASSSLDATSFGNFGGDGASAYLTQFSNIFNSESGSIIGANGDLTKFIGYFDQSDTTKTYGTNTLVGWENGMIEEAPNLNGTVEDIANGVLTTIASTLGIASPSTEGEALGEYFDQGLVNGLLAKMGLVDETGSTLATRLLTSIQGAMATVSALAENDFDIAPRITPVVDMTGVESSANAISGLFSVGSVSAASSIGRTMADLENVASNMQSLSEAKNTMSNDSYVVNIYPSADMDEEAIADSVIYRLSNGLVRKEASLG